MKKLILFLLLITSSLFNHSQNIIGAWESSHTSDSGRPLKSVAIFADGYQVLTTYYTETGKFINTNGGTWKLEDDMMTEMVEFDSRNPELIGKESSYKVRINKTEIEIIETGMTFKRLDNGSPGKLQGAWLMSGRIRDGKTQLRDTNRPRKTMKILSVTRFQWIAYNTETKEFKGTGGGTYTTINGAYTENIEFFSKDDSKAGLSLQFSYELIDGKWHHSGLSSKGNPINEIWAVRK